MHPTTTAIPHPITPHAHVGIVVGANVLGCDGRDVGLGYDGAGVGDVGVRVGWNVGAKLHMYPMHL